MAQACFVPVSVALPVHIRSSSRATQVSKARLPSLVRSRRPSSLRAADEKSEVDSKAASDKGGNFYNDERPQVKRDTMSPEMKKKLKDEYLGLGGSPNTPLQTNYFLWIIVAIGGLALLSWVTGAI